VLNDFYSKLNAQEKKMFYVALTIVLLMVVDRLFLGPSFSKMKSYDDEIDQQKRNIQQDLRFLTYKNRILEDDQALSPYYVNEYTTEEQVLASFLKKLEMIATESKIVLIKVTPSETKERKGYKEYYANLECEGLLENVSAFMHAVDTSQDLLKIVKVNFTLKRASGDEVLAAMVVSKMFVGNMLNNEKAQALGASQGPTGKEGLSSGAVKDQKNAPEQNTGSSNAGGSPGQPEQKPDEQASKAPQPAPGQEQGDNVSWRYQMKGFKPSKNDLTNAGKNEPAEPLKASVFEKIVTKVEKKSDGNAAGGAAGTGEQK